MTKKFYITTPIYYANWLPHIWHANSSFMADVYARYKRLLWYDVKFSTGMDENSQKIVQKAEELNMDVMKFLDEIEIWSKRIWDRLNISYTDFIRTTEERHKIFVQKILSKIYDNWKWEDIYQWEYQWLYCVWCEAFKNERDLNEQWLCPDHLTKPDIIKEKNRFFKLKKYEQNLKDFFKNNPNFIESATRFNEVKAFVNGWLEDFSISRETNKFWIPLPFDNKQVTYVWFDALLNYITVCQEENEKFRSDDTYILHILWKDIVKFHATYRPAMLISAWYRLPDKEFVTWYLTVDGQKMSKSIGNIIDPVEMADKYDRDAVIFNLLYDVPIWSDWDFSEERLKNVYESMLIWWRWNLVNRVTSLCAKYGIKEWKINKQKREDFKDEDNKLASLFELWFDTHLLEKTFLEKWDIQWYLQDRYRLVQNTNEFITKAEPRKKYKDDITKADAISDLQFLLYIVKNLALLSSPILINWFQKIQEIFWNEELNKIDTSINSEDQNLFKEIFDLDSFSVNLNPTIIYIKKE